MYNQDAVKNIKDSIEAKRAAAASINRIKPIIRKFDGKVYNKRFDEAIAEASDNDNRFYCYNSYGWFYLELTYKRQYALKNNLISGYSCKNAAEYEKYRTKEENNIFNEKRINANIMIQRLDESRERLNREAYEMESTLQNMDIILEQIKGLKKALNNVIESVPYEIQKEYRLNKIY